MAPASYPSLLVFGSLTALPAPDYRSQIRSLLLLEPSLRNILTSIRELPSLWRVIAGRDSRLDSVPGHQCLQDICEWIDTGHFNLPGGPVPNSLSMPFAVIVQIVQYYHYRCKPHETASHSEILRHVRRGGIQGFCTGLLTAIALACSRTEEDLDKFCSVAIRLALCIGAYVDLDSAYGDLKTQSSSLVCRWAGEDEHDKVLEILRDYPEAYIAVVSDNTDITITTSKSTLSELCQRLSTEGMMTKALEIHGRYHTARHTELMHSLSKLCDSVPGLAFPYASELLAPVRSNFDAQVFSEGPLHQHALKCILIDMANWYLTMTATVSQVIGTTHPQCLLFGLQECISPAVVRESGMKIVKIWNEKLGATTSLTHQQPALDAKSCPPTIDAPLHTYPDHAVAVIGMSCRFPGANSLDEFWKVLSEGASMLQRLPTSRFLETHSSRANLQNYWGNFVSDIDAFDHRFFKKSSREAASMDPQQRLLMEVAYEAVASAGCFSAQTEVNLEHTGCYVGVCANDYNDNVACHPANAFSSLGTLRAFLSGKISHYFGWTGPSLTVDTACSSSAVAIDLACKAITLGECTQALAGGASLYTSPYFYENLSAASFLSPSGATKPFDAAADGYCRGEGVGLVMLKRLSAAIRDGDLIYGVITASAVNQNGNKTYITVPYSPAQVEVYKRVCMQSQISPLEVSYVEAHGTGTPVGDPVEMESIRQVFAGSHRIDPLFVSSVKGNIGHLEGASGVAALIKVCLMMHHRQIPMQANFRTLNPKIPPLEIDQVEIPIKAQSWKQANPVACINNYGAAGSNAALIVRGAPSGNPTSDQNNATASSKLAEVPVYLTAASPESLKSYCRAMKKKCMEVSSDHPRESVLASIAYNLAATQNPSLPYSCSTTVKSMSDLVSWLDEQTAVPTDKLPLKMKTRPVVMFFSGQVGDVVGLDKQLYESCYRFRYHLDRCDTILRWQGYPSLYPNIFEFGPQLDIVALHCMLFAIQFSSAATWIDSGLKVAAVLGHSFGQLTALCVSGSLDLQDGIKLVAGRASLIQKRWGHDHGAMLAVEADIQKVLTLISGIETPGSDHKIEIACHNGPTSHVLVGSDASIHALEARLRQSEPATTPIKWKRLTISHAFHSHLTEPLLPELLQLAQSLSFKPPTIPFEACSADTDWAELTPELIVEHLRSPVHFSTAVGRLFNRFGPCTWVEAFSIAPMSGLVKRNLEASQVDLHHFESPTFHHDGGMRSMTNTVVGLWKQNNFVQFWPFHRSQRYEYERMNLPPYQFEKTRHWLTLSMQPTIPNGDAQIESSVSETPLLSLIQSLDSDCSAVSSFRINIASDEFCSYVKGHSVLDEPLCPAPFYVEMAARACMTLNPSIVPNELCLSVENLEIKAPLGLDSARQVLLSLETQTDAVKTWRFSLTSINDGSPSGVALKPTLHCTGCLTIETDHTRRTALFSRYERIIDSDHFQKLQSDPKAAAIQGSLVYNVFSSCVNYAEYYKGVRGIWAKDRRVVASVTLPDSKEAVLSSSTLRPLAVDNFVQVAGLHVNSLNETLENEVYVCTQIDEILIGPQYQTSGPSWIVYSEFTIPCPGKVLNDIFVFDAESKRLALLIFGAQFSKVAKTSLRKLLSRANANARSDDRPLSQTQQQTPVFVAQTAPAKSPKGEQKISTPRRDVVQRDQDNAAGEIRRDLKALLAKVAEIPNEVLQNDSLTLAEIGVDSLLAMEVLSEVNKHFGIAIPADQFASLLTLGALLKCIAEKKGASGYNEEFANSTTSESESRTRSPISSTPATSATSSPAYLDDQLALLVSLLRETLGDIKMDQSTNLVDAGLDSLLSIELVTDIQKNFGVVVDFTDLGAQPTFGDLANAVLAKTGRTGSGKSHGNSSLTTSSQQTGRSVKAEVVSPQAQSVVRLARPAMSTAPAQPSEDPYEGARPNLCGQQAFEDNRYGYEKFSEQTGFSGFWKNVYPLQSRLVLAYVVEAFSQLGCPLNTLKVGSVLPEVDYLPRHKPLFQQLLRILKDGGLVASDGRSLIRTHLEVDKQHSSTIYDDLLAQHPQHALEHKLLRVTGSRLADCLRGTCDALHLLFRNAENRELLERVYAQGPMYEAITKLLAAFLQQVYDRSGADGSVHILEIGGGTGGTTKHIIELLDRMQISYTYTFTDISGSLVAAAKRQFESKKAMRFMTLDVEKPVPSELIGKFHTVISTNCVHATRNLEKSLSTIRSLLREDGFVALVEFTRNIYWFDLVFGLLDGWWLFEDGRQHVLADERTWDRDLRNAGFKHVSWTDGINEESRTLRIITGFLQQPESPKLIPASPRSKSKIETIVWSQVGELLLYADVYLPDEPDHKPRPIALLIHGGGHVLLTRNDVGHKFIPSLLEKGFLPISVEYRFCPELNLVEGPMHDVSEALRWARDTAPQLELGCQGLVADGNRVVAIGWSTGGHLAMSLAFTAPSKGIRPPDAVLGVYCPTDYESDWWKSPIYPRSAASSPKQSYDLYAGIKSKPLASYYPSTNKGLFRIFMSPEDERWRFVLHMNWKAQTLPFLLDGLPSRKRGPDGSLDLAPIQPYPSAERVAAISPYRQIMCGNYKTPTYLLHGTDDDFIPWQHSQKTYDALRVMGVPAGVDILEGADHLFDVFGKLTSEAENAMARACHFLWKQVFEAED